MIRVKLKTLEHLLRCLYCCYEEALVHLVILVQASNYMFKVSNKNTRTRRDICSKLTTKTLERRHKLRSGVFIVNFEHTSHLVLVFLIVNFKQVNADLDSRGLSRSISISKTFNMVQNTPVLRLTLFS